MAGLYIHVPFCESRCIYCGFYSTTSLKLRDDYIDAVCKEMQMRPTDKALGNNNPKIETIYLGGGTPSLLNDKQLHQLFHAIQENYIPHKEDMKDMEITMECNPDDVTDNFCETLKGLPVNRISMGAQTFSDERLHFLHRRHQANDVSTAVNRLRAIGIHNISIDLMFGFPKETLEDWKNDIREALSLGVQHISAYSLMYEEGTALYKLLEQEKVEEIDEELSRNMYDTLIDMLTAANYEQYEISNFSLPNFRSRHNSSYWHEIPYIGIGAAAHSYRRFLSDSGEYKVIRSWNVENLRTYIKDIQEGILPSEKEDLDLNTRFNDMITTALRTREGINLQKMKEEFGEKLYQWLLLEAQEKIDRGFMKITENSKSLSLTRSGLYISDDIMGDFMIV